MPYGLSTGGAALAALLLLAPAAMAEDENPFSPLPDADGVENVAANCTACHSARTFIHMNQGRDWWDDTFERMKRDHGMWDIDPEIRAEMLDYLEEHLGEEDVS